MTYQSYQSNTRFNLENIGYFINYFNGVSKVIPGLHRETLYKNCYLVSGSGVAN